MTKRNSLKSAWRGIRANRDKMEMSKVRSTPWVACLSKNHLGVMKSQRFHLI